MSTDRGNKRTEKGDDHGEQPTQESDDRGKQPIQETVIHGEQPIQESDDRGKQPMLIEDRLSATLDKEPGSLKCREFRYAELKTATRNFHPDNALGDGAYGQVYRGFLVDFKKEVAINVPSRGDSRKQFLTELNALTYTSHPNVIELIGYCNEQESRIIVYELMTMGSLKRRLRDLDWTIRVSIALQVAQGLQYLHEKMDFPIVHGDLKIENILLGPNYQVKIGDFGLAQTEYNEAATLGLSYDIYNFGGFLFELFTGCRHPQRLDISMVKKTTAMEASTSSLWSRVAEYFISRERSKRYKVLGHPILVSIVEKCLRDASSRRPSISDVLKALELLSNEPPYDPSAPPTLERTWGRFFATVCGCVPFTAGSDRRDDQAIEEVDLEVKNKRIAEVSKMQKPSGTRVDTASTPAAAPPYDSSSYTQTKENSSEEEPASGN